jgi:putative aldouronate transport system substrate-binding protein
MRSRICRTAAPAVFLVALLLSSCGGGDELFSELDSELAAGNREEVSIHLYFPGESTPELDELFAEIQRRSRRELNLTVDFSFLPFGSYIDSVVELLDGGTDIDGFFYFPQFEYAGFGMRDLARTGRIRDLGEDFPRNAPSLTGYLDPEFRRALNAGGGMYVIPGYLPVAPKLTVMVREDFVNRFEVREIRDFAALETLLDQISRADGDVFPLALNAYPVELFAHASGYDILDRDLELVYRRDDPGARLATWESTPEYEQGINRILGWIDRGYLNRQSILLDPYMIIASGRWAVITTQRGFDMFLNSYVQSRNSEWNYVSFTMFPEIPAQRSDSVDYGVAVAASSEHADRVLQFFDWFHRSRENHDLMAYGIEGEHFRLRGGVVEADPDLREGALDFAGKDVFFNLDLARGTDYMGAESLEGYREFIETESYFPRLFGFRADAEPVGSELRARFFAFDNSAIERIKTGTFRRKDIAEYQEFMLDKGSDRIVSVFQEQVDAWLGGEQQ